MGARYGPEQYRQWVGEGLSAWGGIHVVEAHTPLSVWDEMLIVDAHGPVGLELANHCRQPKT